MPDADKLVELILDVGELGEKRVFAGIKEPFGWRTLPINL
ncbi:MAG: hypothetical protein Ct9H90mP22_5140 [Gammaproteobacteria bacterium]|nr:MAG: hypothetical protein Ct9H90mP22_5140 [Gammaproteobacteria bacterium]